MTTYFALHSPTLITFVASSFIHCITKCDLSLLSGLGCISEMLLPTNLEDDIIITIIEIITF